MVTKVEKVWLDGELVGWDAANVHVLTHTLHYGLAVFEGIRAYQRADGRTQIFRLHEHIKRLFNGAKIATIKMPYTLEQVEQACHETVRANGLRACYLRPVAFVGDGTMGLGAMDNRTRVAIVAWPWGSYLGDEGLKRGIRATVSSYTRHHVNASMVKAKMSGQYVNSVLAKREAMANGYDEALLLDAQGYVCEASGENVFAVINGVVVTPPKGASILNGITRQSILTIAREHGLPVSEERLTRDELYIADEIFLTGTAAEVTPVRELDRRPIGQGSAGPITMQLQETFFDIVRGSDNAHQDWLSFVEF